MVLEVQDIEQIAEQLPYPDAGDRQIAEIIQLAEMARPRDKLFGAAVNLQLLTEGLIPGIEQTGLPAIRPAMLPVRTFNVSYGFISLSAGLAEEIEGPVSAHGNFTFGISVLATAPAGELWQERLDFSVEFAGRRFPVIVTHTDFEPQGVPPHPGHPSKIGSSACWVKSNAGAPPFDRGILTARHVIDQLSLRTLIDLDPSTDHNRAGKGYLADGGHCMVDAAVIEINAADWPAGLSPLKLLGPFPDPNQKPAPALLIAPGDAITFDGRFTAPANSSVLSHHPLPGYWGSMMGQRLVLDAGGVSGDSGALAVHNHTGAGAGIYMGTISNGQGGRSGLCQDLYQAVQYLEVDPYL
ncbi:hypothetical protein ACWKW9_23230 [Rhizobium daejeonense]